MVAQTLALSQEEKLAEKVKEYPCLYDKKAKGHKERDVMKNAWQSVADQLVFAENGQYVYDNSLKQH